MKTRMVIASALLVLLATTATAEQNFVQKFLGRYRPPTLIDPSAAVQTQGPEQTIQELIRQGILPVSVSDVIRLAVASNLDVKVDRYAPLTQQFLIDTLLRPFEPTLRLNAQMNRVSQASPSLLVAGRQLSHRYSVQFSQFMTTGTGVSVTASVNRQSDNNQFNTFNPSYSGAITYAISQNLLRDYGRNVNLHSLRVSRNNKAISDIQFELSLIELVRSAQQMYWDLYGSREDIKVKQQSMELAEKTLSDNKRQVEIGTLAPIDIVQTEANLASRQEQMVVATYSSDQLQDRIKRLITSAGDPAMILARLMPTEAVHRPDVSDLMPVQEAIRYALENRPEMRQSYLSLQSNDIDIEYAKNQLLPALSVNASYTQSGVGGNLVDRTTGQVTARGGVFDAFGQIWGYDFTGYSVGFNLSIPLSNKSAQAEYSRAMTTKQSTEARRTALAQAIALDVRNAYSAVEMNRARITAAEKARELAERQLDAEQKKFQLGSGQIRFVLQEQQNLTAAQTSEIQSLVNYTKALVEFDRAIGRTLKRNNIAIDSNQRIVAEDGRAITGTATPGK
jgi:outer membrane protein